MDFNPGISLADRGGAQVQKPRGGGSEQNDLVLEQSGWQAPRQHIGGGVVPERATFRTTGPSERDQGGSPIVDRDREPASVLRQADAVEAWERIGRVRRTLGSEFNVRKTDQSSKQGQCEGLVDTSLVFGKNRRGAHHAIRIRDGVEKARMWRGTCNHLDIGTVAVPGGHSRGMSLSGIHHTHRLGQHARAAAFTIAGEIKAQYYRTPLKRLGKKGVMVQPVLQLSELFDKPRLIAQVFPGKLTKPLQTGAVVRFREHDVKARYQGLLSSENFVRQIGHPVAWPGPPSNFGQAFFVNVDDDDPLVQRSRHRGAQTRVIDQVVEPVQQSQLKNSGGMKQREQDGNQADGDTRPVPDQGGHPLPRSRGCAGARHGDSAVRPAQTASGCPPTPADPRS